MATKKRPLLSNTDLETLTPATVDEPVARSIVATYAAAKDVCVRRLCLCACNAETLAPSKRESGA